MVRLTRIERVGHNRKLVLDSARAVFLERGFHNASVDEISERAGFSKGVVYSQFGSKDDLFLAILTERIEQRARQNLEAARDAPASEILPALTRLADRTSQADQAWALLLLEFRVHAARNPELNRRFAEAHDRTVRGIADAVELIAARMGTALPFPVEDIARYVLAVDVGYSLERLVAEPTLTLTVAQAAIAGMLNAPPHSQPEQEPGKERTTT
jgi:AcrR family transcriptional regulator